MCLHKLMNIYCSINNCIYERAKMKIDKLPAKKRKTKEYLKKFNIIYAWMLYYYALTPPIFSSATHLS